MINICYFPAPDDKDPKWGRSKVLETRLTDDDRNNIYTSLLRIKGNEGGVLPRGTLQKVGIAFLCSRQTVGRIWKRGQDDEKKKNEDYNHGYDIEFGNGNKHGHGYGVLLGDVRSQKRGRCGAKKIDRQAISDQVEALPYAQRTSLRSIEANTDFSKSTIHRTMKHHTIRARFVVECSQRCKNEMGITIYETRYKKN